MPIMPLFGTGLQGKSSTVTAQTRTNVYAELLLNGEKSQIAFYGTPGLLPFYSFGDTPVRGSIAVGDFKYDVHRGVFWEVNNAGVKVNRGTLNTTAGRVQLTYNGTQIAMVDGINLYVYTIATNAFAVVTTNVIDAPIDITFQDSYGILAYRNGRFQLTASYDFTTLDALDYATAESNPDGLVRVIADHGELILFGAQTVEFWINSPSQDFAYVNQKGTTLEFGLAAPWSCVKYNDSICGLFKNTMGQVQVMVMAGHALRKISDPDLDYIINKYGSVADATAFSYLLGGHPMYEINFPSEGKSWLYDASSNMWTVLQSGLSGMRHRAEIQTDFLNKPRVSDYMNGNVYTLNADTYTDNGEPIVREITSRHLLNNLNQVAVHRLQIDFETGVGMSTGQGQDPKAMLQISKDNGHTWGNEKWASIGKIGGYLTRTIWRCLGTARDWTFRVRVTDPVPFRIAAVSADVELRQ